MARDAASGGQYGLHAVTGHGGRIFGGVTSTPETLVVEFCLYMPAFVSFIPSNSDRARDIILWVVMLIFGLCAKSQIINVIIKLVMVDMI
jgi:hypothetical protein